jgi:alkylglycerol monooxygenase
VFRGLENALYIYIYDRFRVCELAWNSASTWYFAALAVDFCYYWVHRASHGMYYILLFICALMCLMQSKQMSGQKL